METRIRPATPDDIDRITDVNIRAWNSTYRGLIADEFIYKMTPETVRTKWERTFSNTTDPLKFTLVAVDENNVPLGYAVWGKNRNEDLPFDVELYAIYLLKEYQGKGIGKELFSRSITEMKKQGVRSFILFVLETNQNARKFYESFSPDYECEKTVIFDDIAYRECGYGWTNLESLVRT